MSEVELRPTPPRALLALLEGGRSFEEATGFVAADGLLCFFFSEEVSPEWLEALRDMEPGPWETGFFLVRESDSLAVGTAGFKGAPDESGFVEIAYAVVPEFEGRGYATEAVRQLVSYAAAQSVTSVRAHTLRERNASTRVFEKCGFELLGEVEDAEDGLVWRWELSAADTA